MTLAELSAAWQSIRNAAFGRSGLERHVSELLAKRIEKSFLAWRQWYEHANAVDDATGSFGGADTHITELRRLTALAEAEGLEIEERLPETSSELIERYGQNVVVVAVVGFFVWLAFKNKGGGRGR